MHSRYPISKPPTKLTSTSLLLPLRVVLLMCSMLTSTWLYRTKPCSMLRNRIVSVDPADTASARSWQIMYQSKSTVLEKMVISHNQTSEIGLRLRTLSTCIYSIRRLYNRIQNQERLDGQKWRLSDLPELNYLSSDKSYPRGEFKMKRIAVLSQSCVSICFLKWTSIHFINPK